MDDPALDAAMHQRALAGLARVHRLSGTGRKLFTSLREALPEHRDGRVIRIADLACGGGDLAVQIERLAAQHGLPWHVDGVDISETALARARRIALRPDQFQPCDVLGQGPPPGYDAVISSLFLHHLDADDATSLLRRCGESCGVVVMQDLSRGWPAWAATWLGVRLLSRSPVVHIDGPRSVRAAYAADELHGMAESAGLNGAAVKRQWPWRLMLTWVRA